MIGVGILLVLSAKLMRIVTYNLRFGGKGRVHWQEIINRYDPDVLLVQESFAPSEHLPDDREDCQAVWAPVVGKNREMKWGSGVYVKNQSPKMIRLQKFHGWVVVTVLFAIWARQYWSNDAVKMA
jgi:hypothetical protein